MRRDDAVLRATDALYSVTTALRQLFTDDELAEALRAVADWYDTDVHYALVHVTEDGFPP